jgi:hypothetical protein
MEQNRLGRQRVLPRAMATFETMNGLLHLRLINKFAPAVWLQRGLTPSTEPLCQKLQEALNSLINQLRELSPVAGADEQFTLFREAWRHFETLQLDTEESELVADWLSEIAAMAGVDIAALFHPVESPVQPPNNYPVSRAVIHACRGCGADLKMDVLKEQKGIPACWKIVQCNACQEFGILTIPSNVSVFWDGAYFVFERVRQNEFPIEYAEERMRYYQRMNA